MLWHYRLGHPSFHYLKYLFPECHRTSFSSQLYKASSPFTIIHSDVWGPSLISTPSSKWWFVTFIDDHMRLTWVYLMREKSEVETIFKKNLQDGENLVSIKKFRF